MTTSMKPARLDGSLLLARKGEAMPAVAATSHNNPGLAWGAPAHPQDISIQPKTDVQSAPKPDPTRVVATARLRPEQRPEQRQRPDKRLSADSFFSGRNRMEHRKAPVAHNSDLVALTLRVEDDTYLRLKYLAQQSGHSPQHVLTAALDNHLSLSGVPKSRKLFVKPG